MLIVAESFKTRSLAIGRRRRIWSELAIIYLGDSNSSSMKIPLVETGLL